ncbi:MAG TPA: PAS domain S-box protein [Burkholderiales bacterium]|nr:PAS domain S-box protein [Burkholderiales bacterium]
MKSQKEPADPQHLLEQRFAAIVENSEDAIISKDLNGVVQSWNPGAEALFGYTAKEAIGQPITIVIPSEKLEEEADILGRIRRGQRVEHFDTVRRRKDGTLIDISVSISPIIGMHGKVLGASKIARDIGDRVRAEKALKEADRRKDEFLAMLSHELRNPLAPIRNAVTLLKEVDDEATRSEACAILERQVAQMTRLVDGLLDLTRISRGVIEMRKSQTDLATVVRTAIESSRPVIDAGGHKLEIRLPQTPVGIFADSLRMVQVVSNLLHNAAKYTPRGGLIRVSAHATADTAAISVRDNGIGIPSNELSRIFTMFTQLDGARRHAPGGLGVGLALSKQLVSLHGGTIEATSAGPGQGSEFVVRFPLPVAY